VRLAIRRDDRGIDVDPHLAPRHVRRRRQLRSGARRRRLARVTGPNLACKDAEWRRRVTRCRKRANGSSCPATVGTF
jgi:hypothetical protein